MSGRTYAGSLLPRILDVVWADGPITVADIAERLDAKHNSVGTVISRNPGLFNKHTMEEPWGRGVRQSMLVSLSAEGRRRHADEAVPF